jgi:hypothetical protein
MEVSFGTAAGVPTNTATGAPKWLPVGEHTGGSARHAASPGRIEVWQLLSYSLEPHAVCLLPVCLLQKMYKVELRGCLKRQANREALRPIVGTMSQETHGVPPCVHTSEPAA